MQKISQELIASKKQIFKDLIQELVSKQNQLHKYYELMKILAVAKPYMGEYAKAFELVQKLRLKQITHISHKDLVDSVREIWLVNGSPYGINPYIHNFVNDWFKHNYFKISHAAMLNLLKLHPLDEIDQSVHISDSEEQKSKSNRAIEHIIESNVNNNFDVVPTGFENLDATLGGGLELNNLHMIVAPTSAGKTSTSVNIALNMTNYMPVCYMMSEQGDISIRTKILGVLGKIKAKKVDTHDKIESLYIATHQLNKLHDEGKFYIYNTPNRKLFKMSEITSVIENLSTKGYKIFFIDNINYIECPDKFPDLATYAKRIIVPELNSLTNLLGVTIVLVGQVNNLVAKNKNFSYGVSDILGGQSIAQACHSIISIHYPKFFISQTSVASIPPQLLRHSILKILKVRDGGDGGDFIQHVISFGEYIRASNEQEIVDFKQLLKQTREACKGE